MRYPSPRVLFAATQTRICQIPLSNTAIYSAFKLKDEPQFNAMLQPFRVTCSDFSNSYLRRRSSEHSPPWSGLCFTVLDDGCLLSGLVALRGTSSDLPRTAYSQTNQSRPVKDHIDSSARQLRQEGLSEHTIIIATELTR